jgi:sterol 3beta-glucosyltransferase
VSSVLEILPEDPKQPRVIRTILDGKVGVDKGHLEFDTIESAREWRREFQGMPIYFCVWRKLLIFRSAALFFVKRRKHSIFSQNHSEDLEGIHINIPLHHIRSHAFRLHAEVIPVLTLKVDGAEAGSPSQVIELATFKLNEDDCMVKLTQLICDAGKRAESGADNFIDQPVVIDLGIGAEERQAGKEDEAIARTKEEAVCDALAIQNGPNVWSESC